MTTDPPRLTVVIVTWNSAADIGACLDSLRDSAIPGGVETIVVDNASTDTTCDIVARAYPWASLVRAPENLGFARANNLAIARARGDAVLLLNPDVILTDPNAIAGMLRALDADAAIAMVGCRLIFRDGAHQVGDAGFRPSPLNMVCHGLGIAHLLRGLRGFYLVRPDQYGASLDVDWICGACLLVRREAADGGLDARLFMYAEDVEWGCRLRDRGHRVVYLPQVRVVHLQGKSEAQANAGAAPSVRWLNSLLDLYASLNHGRWTGLVRFAFVVGFAGRSAIYGLLSLLRRRDHYRAKSAALRLYALAALKHRAALNTPSATPAPGSAA